MRLAWPSTSPSTSTIWTDRGNSGGTNGRGSAQDRSGRDAGSDGRLQPRHRRDEAERLEHDLRRAGDSHHRPRPARASRRHPRAVVPSRTERRLRSGDRGLPDQETRRLSDCFGARLPERSDGARPRHHELLPDDPGVGLVRARDRRFAAGRLRGDGPARHRQAAVQGGLPCPPRAGHRHRLRARHPRGRFRPARRRLSRPAGQAVRPGHQRRCRRQVPGEGDRRRAGADSRPRRSSVRSTCSRPPSAR